MSLTRTTSLNTTIVKRGRKIALEFDLDRLEAFCNALGLFRKDFLEVLDQAERDHRLGRVIQGLTAKFDPDHQRIYRGLFVGQ